MFNKRQSTKIFSAIITVIVIFGVIFNPLIGTVEKSQAQVQDVSSMGQVAGKALAAGVACVAAVKGEQLFGVWRDAVAATIIGEAEGELIGRAESVLGGSVPVSDTGVVSAIKGAKNERDINSNSNTALSLSKTCVRDVVVKMLMDYFVDETIRWIKGEGKPRFVQDWRAFSRDAVNAGVGEVVRESGAAFLCAPFSAQVRISLLPVGRFKQKIDCTLDQIVGNINNFMDDFREGGWIGYKTLWEPNNNYFGQILLTYDEAARRGAEKKEAAEKEAIAGGGFLSTKKCIQKNQEEIQACITACEQDYSSEQGSACGEDFGAFCESIASCEKSEIITPGDVIGKMAAQAVTSDIEWAKNVQSWSAAIVNAAVNRLITGGLAYMTDSQAPNTDYNYNPATAEDPDYPAMADQNAINGQLGAIIDGLEDVRDKINNRKAEIKEFKEDSLANMQGIGQIIETSTLPALSLAVACPQFIENSGLNNNSAIMARLAAEITDNDNTANDYYQNTEFSHVYPDLDNFRLQIEALIQEGNDLGLINPTSTPVLVFKDKSDDLITSPLLTTTFENIDLLHANAFAELNDPETGTEVLLTKVEEAKAAYEASGIPPVCPSPITPPITE